MPGRLIAMFDACHSGAAAEGLATGIAATDDLVRDLVTEDYCVIVMCSSLGREYSIESSAVNQGSSRWPWLRGFPAKSISTATALSISANWTPMPARGSAS
jgi:hypothetical protein